MQHTLLAYKKKNANKVNISEHLHVSIEFSGIQLLFLCAGEEEGFQTLKRQDFTENLICQ